MVLYLLLISYIESLLYTGGRNRGVLLHFQRPFVLMISFYLHSSSDTGCIIRIFTCGHWTERLISEPVNTDLHTGGVVL